jgi:hypothetical protein
MSAVRCCPEQLNRFQIAREIIDFMMMWRSCLIDDEQKKISPNAVKMAQWKAELDELENERHNLQLIDDNGIQRVIAEYILKASSELAQAGA